MRLDYFLYMAEGAGMDDMVSTYDARLNAVINDFIRLARNNTDINEASIQQYVAEKHGFTHFTKKEQRIIADAVERRI